MKVIRESAEHHFLTTLDKLKVNPEGWQVLRFGLSKALPHKSLVAQPDQIQVRLSEAQKKSSEFVHDLEGKVSNLEKAFIYLFCDHDVVLLACIENEQDKKLFQETYKALAGQMQADFSSVGVLSDDFYKYQKMADQKFLSAKRFEIYNAMSDANKVSSIPVRRSRRQDPRVLIIEDDRFTASYTANILSREYDLTVCRNGEEGIFSYIEEAPDIVFLDIHLPGLSGHDTLGAIKAVDPSAFVVMLSVDTARGNILQASEGGAKNFLKKPFSKERLMNAVKKSPYICGAPSQHEGKIH